MSTNHRKDIRTRYSVTDDKGALRCASCLEALGAAGVDLNLTSDGWIDFCDNGHRVVLDPCHHGWTDSGVEHLCRLTEHQGRIHLCICGVSHKPDVTT